MFKFHEGTRIDKVPGADFPQLNSYKEFDATETVDDAAASLYTPEAINEDKEREEAMINETLTRSEWEEQLSDKAEMERSEEINESEKEAEIAAEDDDLEKDKSGYELFGRFAQYKKPAGGIAKK